MHLGFRALPLYARHSSLALITTKSYPLVIPQVLFGPAVSSCGRVLITSAPGPHKPRLIQHKHSVAEGFRTEIEIEPRVPLALQRAKARQQCSTDVASTGKCPFANASRAPRHPCFFVILSKGEEGAQVDDTENAATIQITECGARQGSIAGPTVHAMPIWRS